MKSFFDLTFLLSEKESVVMSSKMFFENGYGVSVIVLTDEEQYEVAVLVGEPASWRFAEINRDEEEVYRYLSEDEVSEIMEEVQNRLPNNHI